MKSDASNIVTKFIESHEGLFERFVNIYIFGSILDKNRISKDVDILLVYEKYSSKVQDDLTVIQTLLEKELEMFVDFTVLSIEEEKEVSFIDRLKNSYQKLK